MDSPVAAAVARVRDRVSAAARRSGRRPEEVRIVGACKTVPVPLIEQAFGAGIRDLGFNRVQEYQEKAPQLPGDVAWHYFGALQTNKVKALSGVALLHSLCREREARALQAHGDEIDRHWDVLIEVNVAGEASKQGIAPDQVEDLLARLGSYPRVHPRGFMFVAPQAEKPEDVRWVFTEGRRLRDRFESEALTELSMGMTEDYEVAIEEGATIVRIGRAIFDRD